MPKTTLLIVDDEPNILSTLRRALEIEGYGVEVAGGGRIALEKLADKDFDLVLLDVMMPELDGLSTLKLVRERKPTLPVIMMSGHGSLDELATTGPSIVHELLDGEIRRYEVTPESVGLAQSTPDQLMGGDAAANVAKVFTSAAWRVA